MMPKKASKKDWAAWLTESLVVLRPPEKLTVSEWADKHRILDAKSSAEPGKWDTNRTPYLRAIMDAFLDPDIEEITFVKPTQVGGTECINNILGYIICQALGSALVVYPTIDLAEYTSTNRLKPLVQLSPEIDKHYRVDESKILELQFDGMTVFLSGANSAASLATRPLPYVFLDELDKFPRFSGKEASPEALAKERTKTFTLIRKIIKTSTPTVASGPIWKSWKNADTQYKYFVPCPHCGFHQVLSFKEGVKWPKEAKNPDDAASSTYYECKQCKGMISDFHKPTMLKNGEWRALKNNGKKRVAFHINSLYSPWVRFRDVTYEFLQSKDYPELLLNFINSWLAEPWEQTELKMDYKIVLEHQTEYEEGVVPDGTLLLTGGVDVQQDCFYYSIRAWGANLTSQNIAHGLVTSWSDIEYVMNLPYVDNSGKRYQVNLCAIDSGHKTDEVYDFIAKNSDWAIPTKGSSSPILPKYRISTIDKAGSSANGMRLYIIDTVQYKDMIAGRLQRPVGKGSWMVYKNCDNEYAEQICSEEKITEKKGGRDVSVWKPKTAHADNHYLDCEVGAFLAADLLHVRYLQEEVPSIERKIETKQISNETDKSNKDWITVEGDWIK